MHTYASLLAAIVGSTTVTYGDLARGERMHVQSMRRDDLVAVKDASGVLVESLAGDDSIKRSWVVTSTARGRAVAEVLAPFSTGRPVIGAPHSVDSALVAFNEQTAPRHAAPVVEAVEGECGAITRKGTPCRMRVNAEGVCKAHGGPVTVTRVAPVEATAPAAPALDVDALLAQVAQLTALLAGAR